MLNQGNVLLINKIAFLNFLKEINGIAPLPQTLQNPREGYVRRRRLLSRHPHQVEEGQRPRRPPRRHPRQRLHLRSRGFRESGVMILMSVSRTADAVHFTVLYVLAILHVYNANCRRFWSQET